MKRFITTLLALSILMSMSIFVSAYNYSFESGVDYAETLGKSTSTDNIVSPDPSAENVRRNKDAAYSPPSYGIFSGDIPTDPSSLYHDNSKPNSGTSGNTSNSAYGTGTAGDTNTADGSVSPDTGSDYGGMLPSTSLYSADITNTLPLYYDDGSIGTLSIPKFNISVKVYEGETLDNMRIGVGHFEFTSVWDGNVAIAGHNRGVPAAIGQIKNLEYGDEIIYTTKYGTRTYEVYYKEQITDTDYSNLGWSETNILSLITCVENVGNMRWCIIAKQK